MRDYVDTAWGQIHYRYEGDEGPALALFHESPLSSVIFERALPVLGKSLRVWAFDTPGYGLSDPPEAPLEIPAYAARLLAAIDALGLDRFAVGGTHTGASIALEVALQASPGRVTHVVLTGVPLFTEEERSEFLASWAPDVSIDPEGGHLRWAWERYVRIWGPDASPELVHLGAMAVLSNLERYNWAYAAAFLHDPAPALRKLTVPVLLLNAERDLVAYTDPRALELVPRARYVSVPGLVGQVPWRAPDVYAAEVAGFVTGVHA